MEINIKWFVVGLIVVAVFSLMKIVTQWRRFGRSTVSDQDEAFILQLRKAGVNPFEQHDVDFFFTMPDARSSAEVVSRLTADGFTVLSERANPDGDYSLNVQRRMRLIVPEMQALTVRFTALANELGGKYDNWAVAGGGSGGGGDA
ncbi:MAG: ribonuclease E inhibitor RraB [Nevskiaceae bacterium]|jgi:hypothetical protein|nr:ribonuclease E inhibitor RraB [Nevskiaceae bacterium]